MKLRPEAAPPPCPSWCRVAHRPHHPARGLHSNNTTRLTHRNGARKPGRRVRAAPGSRASPGAARCPRSRAPCRRLLRVCLALCLCFTSGSLEGLGRGMEVCLSQGSFSPRDFLIAVLHSLLQALGKKKWLWSQV